MSNRRRYASLAESAQYVGCHERTIRRLIAAGTITGYRLGRSVRIDLNELDEAMTPPSQ